MDLENRIADLERKARERKMTEEKIVTWGLAGLVILLMVRRGM